MKKFVLFALLTLGLQATALAGAENALESAGVLDCTVSIGATDKVEFVGEFKKMTSELKTSGNASITLRSSKAEEVTVSVSLAGKSTTLLGGRINSITNKLSLEQDSIKLDCSVVR